MGVRTGTGTLATQFRLAAEGAPGNSAARHAMCCVERNLTGPE